MKIFFISHSSVLYNYRDKLRLLCRRKDVQLTLLLPNIWPEAGKQVRVSSQGPEKESFEIIAAPIVLPGRVKRHFYPNLSAYIQKAGPDIVHIEEEPYSLVAWQSLRTTQKLKAKFVFFTWENLLERFPFPHQQIQNYVLRRADYGIAGDTEAAGLLQKAGFPRTKTSVIPQYGVDPELFKPKKVGKLKKELNLDRFTVGYVGRLVPEKGIHHLLEAFAHLKNDKSNLLIVGNGPLKDELESQASRLGISRQIRWVNAVDQSRIPDYLNCINVLVLPSLTTARWKEQFGRVLIESQACGVPVIGSSSGAIPEVIGKAGLIFKEGQVGDLTAKLRTLANSPALQKKLKTKGRRQVLSLYTNQKISDQIYGIYQKVLSGEKG